MASKQKGGMPSKLCSHTHGVIGLSPSVLLLSLACVVVFGLNPLPAKAQSGYLTSIGGATFSTPSQIENGYVNVSNGNLHLTIPMGSFPQRGGKTVQLSLMYDSAIWALGYGGTAAWGPTNIPNSYAGWRFVNSADPGSISYVYWSGCGGYDDNGAYECTDQYSDFTWAAPDGTLRAFGGYTEEDSGCGDYGTGCWDYPSPSTSSYATDASGYYVVVTSYNVAVVYAPDGTKMDPGNNILIDPNGNEYSKNATTGEITDTLARVLGTKSTSGSTTTYSIPGAGSSPSTYTVTTESITVSTNFNQSFSCFYGGSYHTCYDSEYSGTITAVGSITLPDSTAYSFTYDQGSTGYHYGSLASVTLPTGGTVSYTFANFTDAYGNIGQWISNRVVSGTGVTSGTWTYTPQVNTACSTSTSVNCQQQNTVHAPSGDETVYTFNLNGGPWTSEIQSYTGSASSGTLLATVTNSWDYSAGCPSTAFCGNPGAYWVLQTEKQTTLPVPGGSVSESTYYTWDTSGDGNPVEIDEHNFDGTLRTTGINYQGGSNYTSRNIINRPTTVSVYDASSNIIAKTINSYDGSSLTSVSGMANHDDSNFGTSMNYRGNLTQVQRLVDGTPTYLTESMTYDMTGQVHTATDWSNSNATTIAYSSTYQNAYPTMITNALSQSTTLAYNSNTGLVTSMTDANGQTTSFTYDNMGRPLETDYPDSGETSIAYNYSGGSGSVYTGATTTTKINSSQNMTTNNNVDALGRASSTQLTSDPSGTSKVDTTYDSSGRVYTVTNPYRSTSDPTYGMETIPSSGGYDGFDRVATVTHADGSVAHSYYGPDAASNGGRSSNLCGVTAYPILSVDEAGNKRQTWTDGFGRLIETDEPDPSSGSLTSGSPTASCYTYDLSNNLTQVVQNSSRTRTFAYDKLSRLTQAATPESGTTYYYYTTSGSGLCSGDPSAVCRRTDARSITTTYSYDALNRLTEKDYSDSLTPQATFTYDVSSLRGVTIQNPIGRLVTADTYLNSSNFSYIMRSYDSMGRVIKQWQWSPARAAQGPYAFYNVAQYNLSGMPSAYSYEWETSWLYPQYDTAGRQIGITSSLNDSNHPGTLASGITYTPPGDLGKISYGNGLTEAAYYDNRLQTCRINVNSSSTSLSACTGSAPSGNIQDFQYGFNYGSTDDGNVVSWSGSGQQAFTRSYGYDYLNRLKALTDSTSGNSCPGLSWSYDTWGNRTAQTVTAGSCGSWSAGYNSANQITNTNFHYDAAGNMWDDGGNHVYYYDAENRVIQVDGTLGNCSTATACYLYDAEGHRVQKTTSGGTTAYINDIITGQVLEETNGSDALGVGYVYLGGQLLAQYRNGTTYFTHLDHLGSTRVMTNVSGGVYDSIDILPFGELIWGGSGTSHKFTGYERDTETGLDNAQARYYSQQFGSFISPDPLGGDIADPQTLNRYAYVDNNPVNLVDPSGMSPDWFGDEGGGGCSWFDPFCFDPCDSFCGEPCWLLCGGGGGGGGGGGRGPRLPPPPPMPGPPSGAALGTMMGETNGIPDGMQFPVGGGGFGGCTYGSGSCGGMIYGWTGEDTAPVIAGACGIQPELCPIVIGGAAIIILAHQTGVDQAVADALRHIYESHKTNVRPSTEEKHEEGEARKTQDRGGEKADPKRDYPRRRPKGWKGPWPPDKPGVPYW